LVGWIVCEHEVAAIGEFVVVVMQLLGYETLFFDGNKRVVGGSEVGDKTSVCFYFVPLPGSIVPTGCFFFRIAEIGVVDANENGALEFMWFLRIAKRPPHRRMADDDGV
jgi:hypothetical protein